MTDALRWMPVALSLHRLRRMVLALLAALVLLQTLGVMHRVVHAPQSRGAPVHLAADTSDVWAAIWGEHSSSADCQLFDQSCPDIGHLPVVPWQLAPVIAVEVSDALYQRLTQRAHFYATRGPPV